MLDKKIRVSSDTIKRLNSLGRKGDSYDNIITMLINSHSQPKDKKIKNHRPKKEESKEEEPKTKGELQYATTTDKNGFIVMKDSWKKKH